MIFLRQSTASQELPLGRFVSTADGDTEMTALTIANTDIKLWKTGATSLANKASGGATHMANGEYYCVLDATDTNTIGPMKVTVHVATALYVQVFCCVLSSTIYDQLFGTAALSTLDAASVRNALGFATNNADTQFSALSTQGATIIAQTLATAIRTALGMSSANLDAAIALLATAASVAALPTSAQVADKLLGRNIEGAADGGRTVTQALHVLRNGVDAETIPGVVLHMKNDGTESFRLTQTTNPSASPTTKAVP